jgi:predicted acetyltransferase
MIVTVRLATAPDRAAIENMMQLYTHDFSEHWTGRAEGDLDDRGRFAAYPLDPYWTDPSHVAFLIHVDAKLAGFALINTLSHTRQPLDRNVAEFFIVRKYRRSGIGLQAAHAIFDLYPGQWEAAVTT